MTMLEVKNLNAWYGRSHVLQRADPHFAHLLYDTAHEHGFKALVAVRGSAALQLAREYVPHAITLDINLPDLDGWGR